MNKKERKEYLKNLPGIRGDELPEEEQAMFFDDHVDSNERRKNIIKDGLLRFLNKIK